ncbi:MAG: hypothetical protein GY788_05380 [bacterium]|nr:hypothetical protein [bacterium]
MRPAKHRCPICGKWFWPSVRARSRQRVCSDPACQRERHRRNCADWHRDNPGYDKEERLRRRLLREASAPNPTTPLGAIDEEAARDAVDVEVFVLVMEVARVVVEWTRDVPRRQLSDIKRQSGRVAPSLPRDDIATARAGP